MIALCKFYICLSGSSLVKVYRLYTRQALPFSNTHFEELHTLDIYARQEQQEKLPHEANQTETISNCLRSRL